MSGDKKLVVNSVLDRPNNNSLLSRQSRASSSKATEQLTAGLSAINRLFDLGDG